MRNKVLKLDSIDNVLIALADLRRAEQISFDSQSYILESDVPAKHKFATEDLAAGASIIMYGVLVGKAVTPIRRGELLTTRNIHHQAAAFQEKTQEYRWTPPDVSRWKQREFLGYRRSDGQVGTRNYWIVVPLVFCENRNIAVLKQAFEEELGFAAPQVYRRQVAELAQLYADGRTEEIKTRALTGDAAARNVPEYSKTWTAYDFCFTKGLRRNARRCQQSLRTDRGLYPSSERGGRDGAQPGLSECSNCNSERGIA